MILTDAELVELTRKKRRSAQRRVLEAIGVPYRVRPDGSLVVFLRDVNEQTGVECSDSAGAAHDCMHPA